jgi:hypothetical protein
MMTEKKSRDAPAIRKFALLKSGLDDGATNMEVIADMWSANKDDVFDNVKFYLDKIGEEYEEMMEGEDETPSVVGDKLETTGDTMFSESVTVLLTILHWQRKRTGLRYNQLLSMLEQRYREQAWRYHVLESPEETVQHKSTTFADGTYWLIRLSRDNRIFGCKTEWINGVSQIREVVDLDIKWHWSDGHFALPASYEPYMQAQNYTVLGDVRGVVFPDGHIVEFFSPRGVELIHEPRKGTYIKAEDCEWQTPVLGSFFKMRHP